MIEIPPKAADAADEAQAADAGPAAGPNAVVGEVRHAAAATHANDILLPEDTDDTSGRRLLFGMVALLLLMLCMSEGNRVNKWWERQPSGLPHGRSGVGHIRGTKVPSSYRRKRFGPDCGKNAAGQHFGSDLQDDVFVGTPLPTRGHIWCRRNCSGHVVLTFTGRTKSST